MVNLPIIDQPRWPAMDAESTPAFLDFKLVFRAGDERVNYEDPMRQYRFEGFKALAQLEAEVRVPSIDFTFKTDPLETSSAVEHGDSPRIRVRCTASRPGLQSASNHRCSADARRSCSPGKHRQGHWHTSVRSHQTPSFQRIRLERAHYRQRSRRHE